MAIVAARRMLTEALDGGIALPMDRCADGFDHLVSIDAVAPAGEWRDAWIARQLDRRAQSGWAGGIASPRLEALRAS